MVRALDSNYLLMCLACAFYAPRLLTMPGVLSLDSCNCWCGESNVMAFFRILTQTGCVRPDRNVTQNAGQNRSDGSRIVARRLSWATFQAVAAVHCFRQRHQRACPGTVGAAAVLW